MTDQRRPDARNIVLPSLAGRVAIVTGAGHGLGRAFAKALAATGAVAIIAERNSAVTLGRPNYLHYITSKAAPVGMTRSMARELGCDGITVNAILPGATFTEIERKTVTHFVSLVHYVERHFCTRSPERFSSASTGQP